MYFRKGEITTILTIGAFVFIGIASLVSSFFINDKPRTTSTSAQTSNRCNPDIGNGMPCQGNEGAWCINCLSKTAPTCSSDQGVGIPFQCQGGVWKNMNTSGECNNTCAVSGATGGVPTPTTTPVPTGSGNNGDTGGVTGAYNSKIDGPGGNCRGGVGGADAKGCGGSDGCRFWEQCANNTGCVDTTNGRDYYTLNPPPANACGPGVGSNLPIWTPQDLANYRASFNQVTPTGTSGGLSPTSGANVTKSPTPASGNAALTSAPTQPAGSTATCDIGDGISIGVGQERCSGTTRLICKINSTGKAVLGQEPDSAKCPRKECNQVGPNCYARVNGAGIYTRYSDSSCTKSYSDNKCPTSVTATVVPSATPSADKQLTVAPDKSPGATQRGTSTTYTFTKDTTTTTKSCSSICASAGLSQLGVGTNGICSCGSSL